MTLHVVDRKTEYKETNLSLRHYSNMHFLLLTLFLGVNSGLFVGLKDINNIIGRRNFWLIPLLVTILAIIFSLLECLLDKYIESFRTHAIKQTERPVQSVQSYL